MKTTHTPGPWEWDSEVWANYDQDQYAPWLIQVGSNGGVPVLTGEIRAKSEADAHLIAAAPDLLEALESAVAALPPYSSEARQAHAAIAKVSPT